MLGDEKIDGDSRKFSIHVHRSVQQTSNILHPEYYEIPGQNPCNEIENNSILLSIKAVDVLSLNLHKSHNFDTVSI